MSKKYILGSLSNLGNRPDYRSADQMNQAARSGKQNIVEAVGQSQTSKKGEIKLLGVANASLEELITDFEDFLRQRNLQMQKKLLLKKADIPKTCLKGGLGLKLLSSLSSLNNLGDLSNLFCPCSSGG